MRTSIYIIKECSPHGNSFRQYHGYWDSRDNTVINPPLMQTRTTNTVGRTPAGMSTCLYIIKCKWLRTNMAAALGLSPKRAYQAPPGPTL